jgi:AraC family cel operon transcriptional repressor
MKIELLQKSSSFDDKNSDFDFHIWKYLETPFHTHKDYYELFLVIKGPIQYYINGEMVTLKTMDMSIVRPADKHRFFPSKNDKSIQHMNLAVDCDYFNYFASFVAPNSKEKIDNASDYILIHLSEEQFYYLNHLKKLINTIPTDSVYQKKTSLNLIFFNMLSYFNMFSEQKKSYPKWFAFLLTEISKPYFVEKSVNDLYNLCPYSSPIIIKTFKTYLNITPVRYLRNLKMTYAKNLLLTTDYNTLDICTRIGFDSLSHFNHVFKDFYGLTPSEYRKKNKIIPTNN